ncbi:hypothetical protein TNCT_427031, partial [Trichonephila clavata]
SGIRTHAPEETARPRYRRKASRLLLYCSQIFNSSKQCNNSRKRKTYFPSSGGIRTHAPEETGALNQRLRPLGHATVRRPLVRSFTAHKLLIVQSNVNILVKLNVFPWQRWDSNPRPRRDWCLKPAPYTDWPRYRRKASRSLLYCSQIINSSKQCNYSRKSKTYFPGSGGIRTHAPEETGALNQRLRPLGHATVERPLVRSFNGHKLLILQNNVTILVKAKRISLAGVGFEPTPPKRLVP